VSDPRVLACAILAFATLRLPYACTREDGTPSVEGVPRFQKVAEGLYRGGQPTREGFEALRRMGIKTIVNLRAEHDEQALVKELGMNHVHIPLNSADRIPEEAIQTFLRVLADRGDQPVFVHCMRGADRTGVMVGLYRIAYEGWSADKAYEEARDLGMRWWHRELRHQLYEFSEMQEKTRNLKPRE